ncbi:hypothetical protein [Cylindrospermopsis raciborskii]|uniref:hypothetical protein n=1 Tax=Cylindrospermopsis raciborskii TaxID=77022 RepID=UPI0038798080
MQVIEKNSLFAQVSGEQSAVVSGGTAAEAVYVLAAFLATGSDIPLSALEAFTLLAVGFAPD